MSAIGTLKARDNGSYSFSIKTLTQKVSGDLVPVKEKKGNGPDFRAFLNDQTEVGAAWNKTSEKGNYVALQFDDPFLSEALSYCGAARAAKTSAARQRQLSGGFVLTI